MRTLSWNNNNFACINRLKGRIFAFYKSVALLVQRLVAEDGIFPNECRQIKQVPRQTNGSFFL